VYAPIAWTKAAAVLQFPVIFAIAWLRQAGPSTAAARRVLSLLNPRTAGPAGLHQPFN
jgi:hypothetical protein